MSRDRNPRRRSICRSDQERTPGCGKMSLNGTMSRARSDTYWIMNVDAIVSRVPSVVSTYCHSCFWIETGMA